MTNTVRNKAAERVIRIAGLSAVVAGLLFIAIQPIHPPETLASVTTATWAIVHYATLGMVVLFLFGISGIYARQAEETGWLGLAGVAVLSLGLLLTGALVFVEAFVEPVLAPSAPVFVEGLLGMIAGTPSEVDLGALPALWSASGALFVGGSLLFGVATLRAGILPRWASALLAFGLPAFGIVVALVPVDIHRVAATPIGLGLAWLGYALWSERRAVAAEPLVGRLVAQPDQTGAA